MKKLLMLLAIASFVACATFQVNSTYEKGTEFSKYKTFQLTDLKLDSVVKNLNQDMIVKAIESEMGKIGFTKSDNADLLVEGMIVGDKYEKNPIAAAGYTYNSYTDGTILVSFIDKTTQKIVWQGSATRTINKDATPEKQEATINKIVKKMLKEYPFSK